MLATMVLAEDHVVTLVEEVKVQALRFALNCRTGNSGDVRVTSVQDPDTPTHVTFILEETEEGELLLVDVDAEHVMEQISGPDRISAVFDAVRAAARLVYLDRHLLGPLREALARAG